VARTQAEPLRGKTTPRIFTPPLRPLEPRTPQTEQHTLGYQVIDFADEILRVSLVPWQRWLLVHMLELLPDGTPRYRTVVVIVARQNGKTMLSIVLALFFMYVVGARTVLGTAQDLDTAEETWQEAVNLIEEDEFLDSLKHKVSMTNGKKYVELKTGERYKVKAANRRAGRGLSGDLIMLDELREQQNWDAWGAITKTTLARARALVLALSNAGDATSVVLRYLRKMAHAPLGDPDRLGDPEDPLADETEGAELLEDIDLGEDTLGIFEWSAHPDAAVTDRAAIAQANPSCGYTEMTERSLFSAIRTDPEWVVRTEVLCQWMNTSLDGPFPEGTWEATKPPREELATDSGISADSDLMWAVDTSHDRTRSYVGLAGWREDGRPQVEVVAQRGGTAWVAPYFRARSRPARKEDGLPKRSEHHGTYKRIRVVVQERGAPASSLIDELDAIPGVEVVRWGGSDLAKGTGAFYDAVIHPDGPQLVTMPQPVLDVAASTAVTKPTADSWLWDRMKSPTDAAPLIAVNGAHWGLTAVEPPPEKSAYEEHGLLVLD
jgi:hypothetical protein